MRRWAGAALVATAYLGTVVGPAAGTQRPDAGFTLTDERITESSGLARSRAHPDVVWTVNDSGGRAEVYAVDTTTGETVGVHAFDAPVRDVEALAIGEDGTMYVADIGDNAAARPLVRIFWFPEPALGGTSGGWSSWELAYPGGPRDAEAFLVGPEGRMALVGKGNDEGIYALPATPSRQGTNALTRVGDAPPTVTDGTWLDDGTVVLRGYLQAWTLDPRTWEVEATALAPIMPQGETVAAGRDADTVLVGSEGVRSRVVPMAVPGTGGVAATTTSTTAPTTTAPTTTAPTTTAPRTTAAPTTAPPTTAPATRTEAAAPEPTGRPGPGNVLAIGGGIALAAGLLAVGVAVSVRRSRRARSRPGSRRP